MLCLSISKTRTYYRHIYILYNSIIYIKYKLYIYIQYAVLEKLHRRNMAARCRCKVLQGQLPVHLNLTHWDSDHEVPCVKKKSLCSDAAII